MYMKINQIEIINKSAGQFILARQLLLRHQVSLPLACKITAGYLLQPGDGRKCVFQKRLLYFAKIVGIYVIIGLFAVHYLF